MKKISKSVWAVVSIYLFSCMPAQCWYFNESSMRNETDGFFLIGRAEKTVRSDRAIFSLQISVIGNSLEKEIKKINGQLQELKDFWKKEGIPPAMIHVRDLEISVQDLAYDGHKKAHKYSITCPIKLIIDDVEKAPKIQEKTMELVEKELIISNQKLNYFYKKILELQEELTLEAIKDGQKMAQNYARSFELPISIQPVHIEPGVFKTYALTENANPYSGSGDSSELDNACVIKVPMRWAIASPEKSSNISPEKRN